MKYWLLGSVALIAIPTFASAGETLTWRHTQHVVSFQTLPVPNTEGHTLNVTRLEGMATFPDGTTAPTMVYAQSDTTNKTAMVRGYFTLKTADGSELWLHYTGTISPDGSSKGTDTVVGGTGRFANAKGEGTFEGTGTPQGADRVAYISNTLTLGDSYGTADDAKAMLLKTAAAIKADRDVAVAQIIRGDNGFRQGDLYPFCARLSDWKGIASGALVPPVGTDVRHQIDATGKDFGVEMMAAWSKPEGVITEVDYSFPKPGTTAPSFPKASLLMKVTPDLGCGVGYYK
jgi:hypothetical protein